MIYISNPAAPARRWNMGKPRLAELPEPAIPEAEKLLGKQVFSHPHSAVFNAWLKRHRVNLEARHGVKGLGGG